MTTAFQARGSQRIDGPVPSNELALRTHPLVFGVMLFLAQDLMLFGGFIAAYFTLRGMGGAWPPAGVVLDETEFAIGTAMLALSSGSMMLATHYLARGAYAVARLWIGTTALLGTAFALVTLHGWSQNAFGVASHAYGSVFYVMTGTHLLHVVVGVAMLCVLFVAAGSSAFERDRRAGAEAIGFYWHFVFLVWLFVGGSIYVAR